MIWRIIKLGIGLLFLIISWVFFGYFHDPNTVLNRNSRILGKEIKEFQDNVKNVLPLKPLHRAMTDASRGQLMSLGSKELLPYLSEKKIDLEIYVGEDLRFWSTNVNETNGISDLPSGLYIKKYKTGWFIVHKYIVGRLSLIFSSPVKYQYKVPNQFLENSFGGIFHLPDYFQITEDSQKLSRPIINPESKKVLAYLCLDISAFKGKLGTFQLLSLLGVLLSFFFSLYQLNHWVIRKVNQGVNHEVKAKNIPEDITNKWNTVVLVFTGMVLPILSLWYFRDFLTRLYAQLNPLFNPKVYHDLPLFHSLSHYILFLFFLIWLIYFFKSLFPYRTKIGKKIKFTILEIILIVSLSLGFVALYSSLLSKSTIPLSITNILDLNPLTFLILGLLGISWNIYAYAVIHIVKFFPSSLSGKNPLLRKQNYSRYGLENPFWRVLITVISFSLLFSILFHQQNLELDLFISLFIILTYILLHKSIFLNLCLSLFFLSLFTSLNINHITHQEEKNNRIALAKQLLQARNPDLEIELAKIEDKIAEDNEFGTLLNAKEKKSKKELFQKIQLNHFERDFPNYDIEIYLYNHNGELEVGPVNLSLEVVKSVALEPTTLKISSYFFQAPSKIGFNDYFGIIPYYDSKTQLLKATVVIRINTRFIMENNFFPVLLLDQNNIINQNNGIYSYAFYKNGSLTDKYGVYPYSIKPNEFLSNIHGSKMYFKQVGDYDHLVYVSGKNALIVVSVPYLNWYQQGTLFSYILGFFIFLFLTISFSLFMLRRIRRLIKARNLFKTILSIRLLYKTRIQVSIVALVFISLMVIGWLTSIYITNQYRLQEKDILSEKINNLRDIFEQEMPTDSLFVQNEKINRLFVDFAVGHAQDLNLYSTNGELLYSSLGKIFEEGLLSPRMDSKAYFEMFGEGRTEFINQETIGRLTFQSGYTPIRNKTRVIGYLNLPYFANQIRLKQRLSNFSNSLINVYLITFIIIGIFAIVLANSLTKPLNLLQRSFSQTKLGNLNKLIPWKSDDEIGDLITEYNKMINTIEESTQKLARSERESAWREMAKQVAHEIKNPLTPLKLGIQLLERAWKEKDPKFEEKFNRFSKTFIEQIDSLSSIATEFSNFAKMPITKEEVVNLVTVIDLILNLFRSMDNLQIIFIYPMEEKFLVYADRDQISRVFTNLLKNASQAIPDFKQGIIKIALSKQANGILISIEDNGTGIPPEIFPKIFHPNFTSKGSGTGLGLAFVKNVIEQVGGTITFASNEKGTIFSMKIPGYSEVPIS